MGSGAQMCCLGRGGGRAIGAVAGLVMLTHAALLCALKVSLSVPGEMFWISHVALAIGGLGLVLGSRDLVGVAFVAVAGLHTLWLVDLAAGLATGRFPLGMTAYVLTADWKVLLGTSHHFYLAPMLGWRAAKRGGYSRGAFAGAAGLLIFLTGVSRAVMPPSLNVNFAHAVLPESESPLFVWFNALPWWAYLCIHAAVYMGVFLAPGAVLLRVLCGKTVAAGASGKAARMSSDKRRARGAPSAARAFTLVELIAVIVVLAVLAGVAIPRYIDYSTNAKQSADATSLNGIRTALNEAFLLHRVNESPSGQWVTTVGGIAPQMHTGALPQGITISGAQLADQRGNLYNFTAETQTAPARVVYFSGGSGS